MASSDDERDAPISTEHLLVAADMMAEEVNRILSSLSQRSALGLARTAALVQLSTQAASEAKVSVERATLQTRTFIDTANRLRSDLRTLDEMQAAVQDLMEALRELENEVNHRRSSHS